MRYDQGWDVKFYRERAKGREATFQFVAKVLRQRGCRTILDVGGGIGVLNPYLGHRVRHVVLEPSRRVRVYGRIEFPRCHWITGTIEDVGNIYDGVVAISLLEHLPGYEAFLLEAWERTRRVLILTLHNGFSGPEEFKLQRPGVRGYYENTYEYPRMAKWINAVLSPKSLTRRYVLVQRDYTEEIVTITKEEGHG